MDVDVLQPFGLDLLDHKGVNEMGKCLLRLLPPLLGAVTLAQVFLLVS